MLKSTHVYFRNQCGFPRFIRLFIEGWKAYSGSRGRTVYTECTSPGAAIWIDLQEHRKEETNSRDAVEFFWSSPFDALVIGSYIIEKNYAV